MRFIELPNLPAGEVKCILIGEKYADELEKPLKAQGVDIVRIPDNRNVDSRLSGHADLSAVHAGENMLIVEKGIYDKYPEFISCLTGMGVRITETEEEQGRAYPFDAGLNLCALGEFLFLNPQTAYPSAASAMPGLKRVNVRQGYTKCSVCAVGNGLMITEDDGIRKAAEKQGIRVLKIQSGHIRLDGYPCGFIGGASFLLSDKLLAFTGILSEHPDYRIIIGFLSENGIKPLYLADRPAFDIGGAVLLTEKV